MIVLLTALLACPAATPPETARFVLEDESGFRADGSVVVIRDRQTGECHAVYRYNGIVAWPVPCTPVPPATAGKE